MRIFVMLVQLIMMGFLGFLIAKNGMGSRPEQYLLVGLAFSAPLVALYYIGFHTVNAKDSYLGLFFERRKLEEQAKINKLKSEIK